MIKFNDEIVNQEKFGDGTLKCAIPEKLLNYFLIKEYTITWCYDNDTELFTLWSLVNQIRDFNGQNTEITLVLPYIPHARQDRLVSDRVFTLKYFAKLINLMNFKRVEVLDPHSDVSTALINNIYTRYFDIASFSFNKQYDTIMFPDNGSAKKYSHINETFINILRENGAEPIIGNKHRNASGRIDSYELLNFKEGIDNVLIVDDICSYGGTFVAAAKALKDKGVKHIDLLVSHCEANIFKGEVFDYIDTVYTTDSLLNISNTLEGITEDKKNKIKFINNYRGIKNV